MWENVVEISFGKSQSSVRERGREREIGALSNGVSFRTDPLQKEKGPKFLIVKCRNSCPRFRRPDGAMREERESLLDFRFFFFFFSFFIFF